MVGWKKMLSGSVCLQQEELKRERSWQYVRVENQAYLEILHTYPCDFKLAKQWGKSVANSDVNASVNCYIIEKKSNPGKQRRKNNSQWSNGDQLKCLRVMRVQGGEKNRILHNSPRQWFAGRVFELEFNMLFQSINLFPLPLLSYLRFAPWF